MKKYIFPFIAILSALVLAGCHTSKPTTQVVTQSVHDTLYLNKLQYDSIFITQEHYLDRSKDTIVIKNITVEYRYRLLRDTIYKTHVDSIPVVKEVTVTKTERGASTEQSRSIPSIYKWSIAICITLIIISIIYIVWKIKF